MPAGLQQFFQRIFAVDGHQPAAGLIVGGVQGHGQVDPTVSTQISHPGHQSGGGNRHPAAGKAKATVIVDDHAQSAFQILIVGQGLAHAHKDDIAQPHGIIELLLNVTHLGDNLCAGQVALKTTGGRQAETATLGTARLARHAQGVVIPFRDQDTFNGPAVTELEKVLAGSVPGNFNLFGHQTADHKMLCQQCPDLSGQVAHRVKVVSLAQINPF